MPSSFRWSIALLLFLSVLAVIWLLRENPPPIETRPPLFEETNLTSGIKTSVRRLAAGREFEIRVESTRAAESHATLPVTGTVIAFVDKDADGSFTADVDQSYAELVLKPGASVGQEVLLYGVFELPVVWRDSASLSFEIDLRDARGDEIDAFSFRIPGIAR